MESSKTNKSPDRDWHLDYYYERYKDILLGIFGTDDLDVICREHYQDYKEVIEAKYLAEKEEYLASSENNDYALEEMPYTLDDITEYFYARWGTPLGVEYEDFLIDLKILLNLHRRAVKNGQVPSKVE